MAAVLLVAHAPLATALLAAARHVYPECSVGLAAVDIGPEARPEDAKDQVMTALKALAPAEVLMLTDVFGATPCNAARDAADGVRTRVVAGVNVSMLWRAVCYAGEKTLDELVTRAVDGGVQGVMQVSPSPPQNQGPRPSSDDPDPRHDQ